MHKGTQGRTTAEGLLPHSDVEMKSLLALHVAVAFIITSSSVITAKAQQEEEEDITGCLAPTSGRATFTVVGEQGVKGDP